MAYSQHFLKGDWNRGHYSCIKPIFAGLLEKLDFHRCHPILDVPAGAGDKWCRFTCSLRCLEPWINTVGSLCEVSSTTTTTTVSLATNAWDWQAENDDENAGNMESSGACPFVHFFLHCKAAQNSVIVFGISRIAAHVTRSRPLNTHVVAAHTNVLFPTCSSMSCRERLKILNIVPLMT